MDANNAFTEKPWPALRDNLVDFLDLTKDKRFIYALSVANVTTAKNDLERLTEQAEASFNINSYLLWSYGQVMGKHKDLHAIKHGKKLIVFDDIDIATVIERELPDGTKQPYPYIIRGVQRRSYYEVAKELEDAKTLDLDGLIARKKSVILNRFPRWMRKIIMRKALKNPLKWKEALGTVAFTNIGSVVQNKLFWPLPLGPYPVIVATGAVMEKQVADQTIWELNFCVCLDHNITDGAPAARFGSDLIDFLEGGEGITMP